MSFLVSENLKVGYPKKIVVDKVNFQLERGEILCLLGPNGCGKSTILKSITDHLKILDGSISILGKQLNHMTAMERAREMSVVLTERIAPDIMTAEEIVSIGRYPHTNHLGKLSKKDKEIIEESINIVNGQNLKSKEFKSLSDGEKQRIMIARAICQEADTMVLDEPTSYLDIRYKIELLSILSKLSIEKKKTIIMSLHEVDLVSKIADKVILIKDGKIFKYGTPEEVITNKAIEEAYSLNIGSFNTTLGNVELPKTTGEAKVFVIGGGEKANALYRGLNKRKIGFYSGVLFGNDIAFNVSKSLGNYTIVENSFVDINIEKIDKGKEYIKKCKYVIDLGERLEGINRGNRELLKFASTNKINILSLRKEDMGLNFIKCDSLSSIMEKIKLD